MTDPGTEYWGGCPECHDFDHFHNVEREHWAACHEHRVKWYVGSNLLSGWQEEGPEVWAENERILADYAEVKPWYPTRSASSVVDDTDYSKPF